MTSVELFIPGRFPGMNEIIAAAKSGRGRFNAYARMKERWSTVVWQRAKAARLSRVDGQVTVSFVWRERDKRRDVDNIAAGAKFVLDGLVKAGVLDSDGQGVVWSIEHVFQVDKKQPGVFVRIGPSVPF